MANKAYIGVNGVARKLKKGYVGVNGVARRIIKAYIGVGGVARPCWSTGSIEYYGTVTPLSVAVSNSAMASIPGYAIFACGDKGSGTGTARYSKDIDCFDRSLSRVTLSLTNNYLVVAGTTTGTSLNPRAYCKGEVVNGTAIFAGGSYGSENKVNDVFSLNTSLTLSRVPQGNYMRYNCDRLASTSIGNYVLFANGLGISNGRQDFVEAYNASLTKYSSGIANTEQSSSNRAAATAGNLALIAGGGYGTAGTTYSSYIDVYDSSLTKIITSVELSVARALLHSASIGGKAMFAGGTNNSGKQAAVDVFDSSLTRHANVEPLSEARSGAYSTIIADAALFVGGELKSSEKSAAVDMYDSSFTHKTLAPLSEGRTGHSVATVGAFALVAGGTMKSVVNSSGSQIPVDRVDAYVYS